MNEYEALCARNPERKIYKAVDAKFAVYGRLVPTPELGEVMQWASGVAIPAEGSAYQASDEAAEALPAVRQIGLTVYGGQPFQAGPCRGHNRVLNGIEYHSGSEVALCIKPCVLLLGHIWDMNGNTYDAIKAEAFYCEAGQVVQTWETTLHYTPCVVKDYFFTLCFLPRGTGNTLPNGPQGILKKQNKWFIAHPDNTAKVQAGDFPGLLGEMQGIF